MKHSPTFVPAADLYSDTMESDVALLAQGGFPALGAALAELAATGVPVDDPLSQLILAETLCAVIAGFENDDAVAAVATIAAMPHEFAVSAHDMLLFARFDGGSGDTAMLDNAGVLALAALTIATTRPAQAIDLIDDESTRRGDDFTAGADAVRAYADAAIFAL